MTSILEEENDDCMGGLEGLFTCEEYVEKTFKVGSMSQILLASNMSSTDHDLTGQIVWPASIYGAWIVASFPEWFRDKCVVELGAGCGLFGFMASQLSKTAIITDGNDVVLKLLERNIPYATAGAGSVAVKKLMWGYKSEVASLVEKYGEPDVIVGADVIMWPDYIAPLLLTIRWLLSFKPQESKCYISYVERAVRTTNLLVKTAAEHGLTLEFVYPSSFLSAEVIEAGFKDLEIRMIKLQLSNPENISFETEPAETEQSVTKMNTHDAPC